MRKRVHIGTSRCERGMVAAAVGLLVSRARCGRRVVRLNSLLLYEVGLPARAYTVFLRGSAQCSVRG